MASVSLHNRFQRLLCGIGTAWKAASDADDGQRLAAAVFSEHGQLV